MNISGKVMYLLTGFGFVPEIRTRVRAEFVILFLSCEKQYSTSRTHGIKGFAIPTKSFIKIGITKIFCYINKMFSSINKTFGCRSKIFRCRTKKIFVVPNFVAVTKQFFSVHPKDFLVVRRYGDK